MAALLLSAIDCSAVASRLRSRSSNRVRDSMSDLTTNEIAGFLAPCALAGPGTHFASPLNHDRGMLLAFSGYSCTVFEREVQTGVGYE